MGFLVVLILEGLAVHTATLLVRMTLHKDAPAQVSTLSAFVGATQTVAWSVTPTQVAAFELDTLSVLVGSRRLLLRLWLRVRLVTPLHQSLLVG